MDVNHSAVNHGPARGPPTADRRPFPTRCVWQWPVMGYRSQDIALDAHYPSVVSIAQPPSILCNHIQHRLNVRRRTGNDAQDFTRRRLLLQRLLELVE